MKVSGHEKNIYRINIGYSYTGVDCWQYGFNREDIVFLFSNNNKFYYTVYSIVSSGNGRGGRKWRLN